MLEIILMVLTFLVLAYASYTDLKTTEVPDWLNFGFIGLVLGIRVIFSFSQGFTILLSGILGLVVFFIIACGLYYTHQWGGGDSKLLMGMGAAIGITYPFTQSSFQMLWFFLALLFMGALYGLFWMFVIAVRKKDLFINRFQTLLQGNKRAHYGVSSFSILIVLLSIKIPALLILGIFPMAAFYLFLFVNSVEKSCFFKRIDPSKLREGDWLAERIIVGKNKVIRKTLQNSDIALLRELKQKKKLNTVLIKEGIPFIPSFLLAYIVLIVFSGFLY